MDINLKDTIQTSPLEVAGIGNISGDDADGESAYSILTPNETPSNIDEWFGEGSSDKSNSNQTHASDSKESKCEANTIDLTAIPFCDICKEQHHHRRLILCVDTVSCDSSDIQTQSSIYSISKIVGTSQVYDELSGKIVVQTTIYRGGFGVNLSSQLQIETSPGNLGDPGLNQEEARKIKIEKALKKSVRDLYSVICQNSPCASDELFLFGEGVGASALVVTAKLLHFTGALSKMKALTQESELERIFDLAWKFCIESSGDLAHPKETPLRQAPKIQFMGLIEVDPLSYLRIKDLPINIFDVVDTYHALGLNQKNGDGVARLQLLSNSSCGKVTEAWFFGDRKDLDGTYSKNGLSLWPLQWLLSESRAKGLVLNSDIAEKSLLKGKEYPFFFHNGVELNIWDISPVFTEENHEVEFQESWSVSNWFSAKRDVFDNDGVLREYNVDNRKRTILHPSVFYHKDQFSTIENRDCYDEEINAFRKIGVDGNRSRYFWVPKKILPHKFRILVCGNNGIGKSTLINSVFNTKKAKVTLERQTQHDIEEEIVVDQNNGTDSVIIHDSKGFETGNTEKNKQAEDFINKRSYRSHSLDENEYIHCIWYCIPADDPRVGDASVQNIFSKCFLEWKIPLVIVYTKYELYEGGLERVIKNEYKSRYNRKIPDDVLETELDARKSKHRSKQIKWITEFYRDSLNLRSSSKKKVAEHGKSAFRIAWTDKDDPESLRELIRKTYDLIGPNIGRVFVKAQMVSYELKCKTAVEDGVKAIEGKDFFRTLSRQFYRADQLKEMGRAILKTFAWDLGGQEMCDIVDSHGDAIAGRNYFITSGTGATVGVATATAIAMETIIVEETALGIAATLGATALGLVSFAGGGVALWALKRHQISTWTKFLCCFTIVTCRATVQLAREDGRQLTVQDFHRHKFTTEEYEEIANEIDKFVTMKSCVVLDYPNLKKKAISIVNKHTFGREA